MAIERAIRRALNPLSTRVTVLVQSRRLRSPVSRLVRTGAGRRGPVAGFVGARPARRRRITRRRLPPRTSSRVRVPDLIGLRWETAQTWLRRSQLVATAPDRDGPPLADLVEPHSVVTDQAPEPGAIVAPGARVTLWFDRGPGSAGVREPRRPRPDPRAMRGALDEDDGEAIG